MTNNNEKALVPAIRFKGFTDAWEQRNVSDIFEQVAIKGVTGLPVLAATQDRGMIPRSTNGINIYHAEENEKTYKRISPGEFVIHLRSFQGGFAHSEYDGIASPAYTVFRVKDVQRDFHRYWRVVFMSKSFIRSLVNVTYGIRDGRSISVDEWFTQKLSSPDYQEQVHVADLITKVELYITLHQRKLDKLKLLKQSLLEKLFPQEGSDVPDVRFKGFTNAWEQRRLGTLFKELNSRSDSYELLSVSIANGVTQYDSKDRVVSRPESLSNYKFAPQGSIVYNTMRMWQGASGVAPINGIVSPAYTVIAPVQDLNTDFFALLFRLSSLLVKFRVRSQGLTSDTWNLKYPLLADISVKFAVSVSEQLAIVCLFSQVERNITLHQRKLDKLKKMKQALLEKMFV